MEAHTATSTDRQALYNALRNDQALIDSVFFGRAGGAALLRSQDPDGTVKFHTYNLSVAGGGGTMGHGSRGCRGDARAARAASDRGQLPRAVRVNSEWAINQAYVKETHTERTTVSISGGTSSGDEDSGTTTPSNPPATDPPATDDSTDNGNPLESCL